MQGLGPQLEAGEKNGECGLLRSPEKLETMVLSEYDVIRDVALCEWACLYKLAVKSR